ncbi:MAG TPA: cation diffusion facilitator family transporter [Gemmatimonadota bacterium]|nr:cation diffusion facilitator family transporter [Gemmatimonadota bacterium]
MAHAHPHPGSGVDRAADRRRLGIVLGLTTAYMIAEVAGGLWTGSLALLADAGHMLTDAASLLLALGALWMARRPATTRHTWALVRVEILAALVNGLFLWVVVGWLVWEAIERFGEPGSILAGPMMAIAAGGLVINAVALLVLRSRDDEEKARSLNVHGAWLHVAGDLLGSLGALAAGAVIWATGWVAADLVASLAIGVLILVSSWRLVREAVHVLLEGAPRHLDVEDLILRLSAVEGVDGIHDLHVWTITSGYSALAMHVTCADGESREMLLARVNRVLRERFGIEHTTIQIEPCIPPERDEPMARPVQRIE